MREYAITHPEDSVVDEDRAALQRAVESEPSESRRVRHEHPSMGTRAVTEQAAARSILGCACSRTS